MKFTLLRGRVLLVSVCVVVCLTGRGNSALYAKAPDLVVEATSVLHGIYSANLLFIRLTSDGKVEWDEYLSWNKTKRNSAMISPEELSPIQQRLDAIDKSAIKPQMGPYATYTDTVVELNIGLATPNGVVRFVVINPWTSDLPPLRDSRVKPMPAEIKSVVCEIWNLHAKFIKTEGEPLCKSSQDSKKNKK
jgi:hypothetical protein